MSLVPPEVRLLPMSNSDPEFITNSVNDLQEKHFLQRLPNKDGHYLFPSQALRAKENAVVLFQWNSRIVASALFLGIVEEPSRETYDGLTGTYKGYLHFDPTSIKVFDLVGVQTAKKYWPLFKTFNQSKQYLEPPDNYPESERNELRNVRRPHR